MISNTWTLIAAPVASLMISLVATRWLAAGAFGPIDHPNARSLHSVAVPRTGGLAVMAGLVAPLLLLQLLFPLHAHELTWMASALVLVAAISFIDDLGDVPPMVRLLVHVAAAGLLFAGGMSWSFLDFPGVHLALPSWASGLLTIGFIAWMINLYNFMDGMDGFAGGMTVVGFSALALLGWIGGEPDFTLAAACVAAAAAGFLALNLPPARIFLGDAGSSSLGLLAAGFSLWGSRLGLFPLWAAWLVFSPFIVDATWTLLARWARGERIWEPHRCHHYQRLVLAGWSHRQTLLRAYPLMAAAAACAVAAPRLPAQEQWLVIAGWAAIYTLVHVKIRLIERRPSMDNP